MCNLKKMIIPVRCFSCGKVIGNKWKEYSLLKESGEDCQDILDKLKLTRYCCRRMLLTHIELINSLLKYNENA
jgi:DNA-directed RNA polymerase I, II, and III subunit RPABC5